MAFNWNYRVGGKRLLLGGLLLLLLLPAGQARFHWLDVPPLLGYTGAPPPHPSLAWEGLRTNVYQPALENYVENRVGFREYFIRLRNQLPYSLLGVYRTSRVVVGRDQVLYEDLPVLAYMGENFAGDAAIAHHVRHLRAVQDTLARRGKLLVIAIAPSKASYLPEYLPAYFRLRSPSRSNHDAYVAIMRTAGINFLDFGGMFRARKDTTSYPLFPRGGTHWSGYGRSIAGDTLLRYIEHQLGTDMRDFQRRPGDVSDTARGADTDLATTMNLIWAPPAYRMMYPTIKFAPLKPNQRQPNLLLIGDSFAGSLIDPFIAESFDKQRSRFWNYDTDVIWPESHPEGNSVASLNRKQQYLERDIILVMFTEYGLFRIDHFSDVAYKLFTPYTKSDSLSIKALARKVARTPKLEERWWRESSNNGMSFKDLVWQAAVARYDSIRP